MIRIGLQCVKSATIRNGALSQTKFLPQVLAVTKISCPLVQSVRTSYFSRRPSEQLWKSVITVSNPGKKRGRGRGLDQKRAKNLNRGQIIGVGPANMYWPGLTGPVIKGNELLTQTQREKDPLFKENILKIRQSLGRRKIYKLSPLERGWSGRRWPGRKIGPPDPIGDQKFENFESIVLHLKGKLHQTSVFGKVRKVECMVVTGNGNGVAGLALVETNDMSIAMRNAKNRAGKRLMYFKRCNDKTIYHNFVGSFNRTKVLVTKMYEGYGIKCHRALKAIADCIGITDFRARVEGSGNQLMIIKAFLSGLLQQKTYQEVANEKKLHVVQLRPERDFYPEVLASPDVVLTPEEARKERHSFQEYVMGNKVVFRDHSKREVTWKGWETHLRKTLYKRNHDEVQLRLLAEYGHIQSYFHPLYPECRKEFIKKPKESE